MIIVRPMAVACQQRFRPRKIWIRFRGNLWKSSIIAARRHFQKSALLAMQRMLPISREKRTFFRDRARLASRHNEKYRDYEDRQKSRVKRVDKHNRKRVDLFTASRIIYLQMNKPPVLD